MNPESGSRNWESSSRNWESSNRNCRESGSGIFLVSILGIIFFTQGNINIYLVKNMTVK